MSFNSEVNMARLTKKSTKEDILKVLVATRSSVKKDYLYYERALMDTSMPDFRKRACEAECERLHDILDDIDIFTGAKEVA